MRYKEKILWLVLKVFSFFLRFVKQKKNRITFITLQSRKLENDFQMINRELIRKGGYDLKYHLVMFKNSIWGNIGYFFSCIYQLFLINSSKVVLLDYNNYVAANFKRDSVTVVQLWHASGAIKKFGNMIPREYEIGNYDYVVCNADAFKRIYAKAFGVAEESVVNLGFPRTDLLFSEKFLKRSKEKLYSRYPELKNKKVVLYAPTFRGRLLDGFKGEYLDVTALSECLTEEYTIIYKMHPLIKDRYLQTGKNILCCNEERLYELFAVSDVLVSDYSAIIFDYTVLNKPILLYTPDYEEYEREVGFCIDYMKDMPDAPCFTLEKLAERILKGTCDSEKLRRFREKYFGYMDGKSCARVVEFIGSLI